MQSIISRISAIYIYLFIYFIYNRGYFTLYICIYCTCKERSGFITELSRPEWPYQSDIQLELYITKKRFFFDKTIFRPEKCLSTKKKKNWVWSRKNFYDQKIFSTENSV